MKVYPSHGPLHLVEANIIEALETGARDRPHPMVRDKEVLLPSHEDVFPLGEIPVGEIRSLGLLGQRVPGGEPRPMNHVGLFGGPPCFIPGLEGMFVPNDFSLKECGQGRVILRETCTERARLECRSIEPGRHHRPWMRR